MNSRRPDFAFLAARARVTERGRTQSPWDATPGPGRKGEANEHDEPDKSDLERTLETRDVGLLPVGGLARRQRGWRGDLEGGASRTSGMGQCST